jgi:hypothetical protein
MALNLTFSANIHHSFLNFFYLPQLEIDISKLDNIFSLPLWLISQRKMVF